MKINQITLSVLFILVINLLPAKSEAQRSDPGDNPDVPIDGGISLLLAAGAAYGVKKIHAAKNKNHKDINL